MTKSKDYRLYTPGTDCYIRGIIREAKIVDHEIPQFKGDNRQYIDRYVFY